jgi:hypothetical protein
MQWGIMLNMAEWPEEVISSAPAKQAPKINSRMGFSPLRIPKDGLPLQGENADYVPYTSKGKQYCTHMKITNTRNYKILHLFWDCVDGTLRHEAARGVSLRHRVGRG